jgi:hypothetical protein
MPINDDHIPLLYELMAEFHLFDANMDKISEVEIARVNKEVEECCQKRNIHLSSFIYGLIKKLHEKTKDIENRESMKRLRRLRNLMSEDPDLDYVGYIQCLWESGHQIYSYGMDKSDCSEWNEDWDGPKF